MFFQLDNEWECSPDINTARELAKEVNVFRQLPMNPTVATLCPRCKDLQHRLWSHVFSFSDSLEALAKRVGVCDLCRLLCVSLDPMLAKSYGEIQFEKFNSYLTRSGRPVAVFYSLPGEDNNSSMYSSDANFDLREASTWCANGDAIASGCR